MDNYLSLFFTILERQDIKIKAISELTGKEYELEDVIWYGNAFQAAQYYLWNCKPVDMTVSPDTKRWTFAFTKADHKKYIGRWNNQRAECKCQAVKYNIKKLSYITNKNYQTENTVKIVNTRQAGLYIKNNILLVDLFWSKDTLVFVFDREESKEVYDLWCRRKLK